MRPTQQQFSSVQRKASTIEWRDHHQFSVDLSGRHTNCTTKIWVPIVVHCARSGVVTDPDLFRLARGTRCRCGPRCRADQRGSRRRSGRRTRGSATAAYRPLSLLHSKGWRRCTSPVDRGRTLNRVRGGQDVRSGRDMVNLSLAARAAARFPRDLARAHRGHASSPAAYLLVRRAHVITSGRSTTALTTSMRSLPGNAEIADPEHLRLVGGQLASQARELATGGACHCAVTDPTFDCSWPPRRVDRKSLSWHPDRADRADPVTRPAPSRLRCDPRHHRACRHRAVESPRSSEHTRRRRSPTAGTCLLATRTKRSR